MKTLFEIQETKPKDIDNNYEAQQLNEYFNSDTEYKQVSDSIDDPEEVRWAPVAKPQPNLLFKLKQSRGR